MKNAEACWISDIGVAISYDWQDGRLCDAPSRRACVSLDDGASYGESVSWCSNTLHLSMRRWFELACPDFQHLTWSLGLTPPAAEACLAMSDSKIGGMRPAAWSCGPALLSIGSGSIVSR